MLKVAPPNAAQTMDALKASGGFAWWYVDLRGEHEDGLVLIWSLGLPFLPGSRLRSSARHRPGVSLAYYSGGTQQFYLLQDYRGARCDLDPATGSGRIGDSFYRFIEGQDSVRLTVDLDEPVPWSSTRLTGSVEIEGPSTALPASLERADHTWSPITSHATGHAELKFGADTCSIRGAAYVDSNVSRVPLHEQNISSWRWGRVSFSSETLIYYEVEETDGNRLRYLYRQRAAQPLERLSGRLTFGPSERGLYGLATPREAFVATGGQSVWLRMKTTVEDGPFYSRSLVEARDSQGNVGRGFSEVVVPDRIDTPWQRPLVRMRTHRVEGDNSAFLPLFNGARTDRVERLFYSITGRKVVA